MFIKNFGERLLKHRALIALSFVLFNALLLAFAYFQTSQWHGVIETKNSHQIRFSTQFKNQLKTSKTTTNTISDEVSIENESDFNIYDIQKTGNNTFLALNPNMKVKVISQSVYSLDDRCSLIFKGSSKMTMGNVGFTCLN